MNHGSEQHNRITCLICGLLQNAYVRLFVLGVIVILSFNMWYIKDDYVVEYPYADVSEEVITVTADQPAIVYFTAERDSLYGFSLYYTPANAEGGTIPQRCS